MDRMTTCFVDGMGAAAATSGVLTQQQARIFALLYLREAPLSLDEIAAELEQSKSNVSINIRGLVEWHLVRRRPLPGSRKDHYVAAADFFRAMQEIFERRFRWTVRQVLSAVSEAQDVSDQSQDRGIGREAHRSAALARERLQAMEQFFSFLDAGIGMFVEGQPFPTPELRNVVTLASRPAAQASRPGPTGRSRGPAR